RHRCGTIITLRCRNSGPGSLLPWESLLPCLRRRNGCNPRALSAMPKRCIRSWTLSAFACWLVLLASADDFNLARLALPLSIPDPKGALPLDDPNTDFTQSSQSPGPTTTYGDRRGCASFGGPSWTGAALAAPFAAPAHGYTPPLRLNTPCGVRF